MEKKNKPVFWITNITNLNVSLADLNLTVKPYSSINLLNNHYHYTLEELKKSAENGSLHAKSNKIFIRKIAPETFVSPIEVNYEASLPTRQRSTLDAKEEKYEELNISDETFAEENAEMAEIDRMINK